MGSAAIKNHTNYWHKNYPLFNSNFAIKNTGMINAFSTVPKVPAIGSLIIFENCVFFHHPLQPITNNVPPDRLESDIKSFSSKSRKRLFNIFSRLNYSTYGTPLFLSLTWHYDSPDNRSELKLVLRNFIKRLFRLLPSFVYIWKLEYQSRGVPHFHILLFPNDKNVKLYSPARELLIQNHWISLKKCKCSACKFYSIKTVSMESYIMSVHYISKEIAKIQDRYFDHDLGRVWGTSQNLRLDPLHSFECSVDQYHNIIKRKLDEPNLPESTKMYLIGLLQLEQNSTVFINHSKIQDLILELNVAKNIPDLSYKKYILKRI
jgi:hypothetical protein